MPRNTGQILTSPTVEMNVRAWVEGKTKRIGDSTARTIASWYHSPSPADEQITRLSHGLPFTSADLIGELERDLQTFPAENADELRALIHWAKTF